MTYDRATTLHGGRFKHFNMNFIAAPTVRGNVVIAVGKVNKVQVSSLLPANGNISVQVRVVVMVGRAAITVASTVTLTWRCGLDRELAGRVCDALRLGCTYTGREGAQG